MRIQRILFLALLAALCLTMVSTAQAAGIGGKVTVEGVTVMTKTINMASEPGCAKMYSTPPKSEDLVVGQGNVLENVVVYISAGAPDESSTPSQPVQLVQKGCRFAPHIVVLQTGQPVQMVNDDTTAHNIHPLATNNREWNKAEPPGTSPLSESFARPEFISVKCNIHPWMHAYFAVLKTSHYAVTGDNGAFSINNLPPGKYTITAWHETLGTQTQEVTVTGTETAPLNFVFKR